MSPRAPRALSPAQHDVLTAADDSRVTRSTYTPTTWRMHPPGGGRPWTVTASVIALERAGLLETGPFVALGTPRLAVVTDAGRAMLTQIRERAEHETAARDR